MSKGKFIIFEGIDGAGKTTIANAIGQYDEFVFVNRKQVSQINDFIDSQMLKHNKLLWTEDGNKDHLIPVDYWIHLQAAWYILLVNFVIEPLLDAGKNVIVDGWYYKLKARLYLQDQNMDYFDSAFDILIKPDLVILFDVDIKKVWERKKNFRAYEFGKFKNNDIKEIQNSFIDYQSNTYEKLKEMALNNSWTVVSLNEYNIDECVKLLKDILLNYLECGGL